MSVPPPTTDNQPQADAPSFKKRLLPLVFLGGLLIFVAFTVYALKTPGLRPVLIYPYEGAMLQTDKDQVNLGDIPTDSKVPYTFTIYNVGGKQLHIMDVEPSCGCTVAELDKRKVNPGRFTELRVTLDTSIKLGKTVKTIDIYSNDTQQPVHQLTLTAQVVGEKKKLTDQ